jgi:hypothetical protein
MINIMSMKKKKAEEKAAGPKKTQTTGAQIRLQKGTLSFLSFPSLSLSPSLFLYLHYSFNS